jgi:3,4-dihydroxy 2-butanone 4-phosphate synthase/GTP cyclohydrolase II
VTPERIVLHREQRAKETTDEKSQRTLRQVGLGGQILSDLGIHKIRLLSNTPTHVPALQGFGIEIVEQLPIVAAETIAR